MRNKAVCSYPFAIQFVFDQFKTHLMCYEAVHICPFLFYSDPHRYITKELCNKVLSEDSFMLKYCPDKCKTHKMCDKAVNSCLLAIEFVPDWFVTNKMTERLDSTLFYDGCIILLSLWINIININNAKHVKKMLAAWHQAR